MGGGGGGVVSQLSTDAGASSPVLNHLFAYPTPVLCSKRAL